MEKKYPKLEDELGEGKHIIKVYKANEWDDVQKKFLSDTHKTGQSKTGYKWWMYNTKIGDKYVSIFGNERNKHLLDSGKVEVNVVPKKDKATGEEIYVKIDGEMKKVLTYYINEAKPTDIVEPEEEVKLESVPF